MWFIASVCILQGPVWPLFAAASTTTACKELLEAVANLRNTIQRTAGPRPRKSLASPENLIRITGLLHFAEDVNRAAGLGLSIKSFAPLCGRRPITVHFVWQMVLTIAGVVVGLYVALSVVCRRLSLNLTLGMIP